MSDSSHHSPDHSLAQALETWGIGMFHSRVLPVIVITDVAQAVPLAQALLAGGIDVMEITLRHAAALASIEAVAKQVPELCVGAGTVTRAEDMARVQAAGARFALSPGSTPSLLRAARDCRLPFIPGVMTPSEVMLAREQGFRVLKFFPAVQAGGLAMLDAWAGPLADVRFCVTGGVSPTNLGDFLALPNVMLAAGSWMTPADAVQNRDWTRITQLASQACTIARAVGSVQPGACVHSL